MPSVLTFLTLALGASHVAAKTNILTPLYMYPLFDSDQNREKGWGPLYTAVENAKGGTTFTAIINPDSGHPPPTPNSDYMTGIAKLKSLGVELLGYVATGNETNDDGSVKLDHRGYAKSALTNYSTWGDFKPSGIFFDEVNTAANQFSNYTDLRDFARSRGFDGTIVLNAGVIPIDMRFYDLGSQIIIFEGCYTDCKDSNGNPNPSADYRGTREAQIAQVTESGVPGSKLSIIVHTLPIGDNATLQGLVDTFVRDRKYGSVFFSDDDFNEGQLFTRFGPDWQAFAERVNITNNGGTPPAATKRAVRFFS